MLFRKRRPQFIEREFQNSLLACCLEILFFILNNTDITLTMLLSFCQIDSYDFWTKIRFFIEMDFFLPTTLKENFLELEKMIMFIYSWKNGSHISEKVQKKAADHSLEIESNGIESNVTQKKQEEDFFFQRLLHLTAIQIQDLAETLKMDNSLAENTWKLMKEILSKETAIFVNRNIIQFILCSIYSVNKMFSNLNGASLSFQQIIAG